jgi:hypothetical protein
MERHRDIWLATGVALISLAGFLVLRPQPAVDVVDEAALDPAVVGATTTSAPLLDGVGASVNRVLAESGSTEVVDPGQLADLPGSVVRVLVDRQAVLTLPEDTP